MSSKKRTIYSVHCELIFNIQDSNPSLKAFENVRNHYHIIVGYRAIFSASPELVFVPGMSRLANLSSTKMAYKGPVSVESGMGKTQR